MRTFCPPAHQNAVSIPDVGITVQVVVSATDEVVAALGRLLPQLSRSAQPVDAALVEELLAFPGNRLLVARIDGRIIGTLTLVMLPFPAGIRARIEAVGVDEAARGQGVGAALTLEALRLAQARRVR